MRRRLVGAIVVVFVAVSCLTPLAKPARALATPLGAAPPFGTVSTFYATDQADPDSIVAGPDGNLWFVNGGSNSIGRITTSGALSTFTDPTISYPAGIALGPDGNLWFTNRATHSIGRITPAGVVSNFTDSDIHQPGSIIAGPDGNLWFTTAGGSIGRISTAGTITIFSDPTISSVFPVHLAAGPDGNVWFSEQGVIGRITPIGTVTAFPDTRLDTAGPLTTGPDGNLWLTIFTSPWPDPITIGRVTPQGVLTLFTNTSIPGVGPITTGPDGNLWFASGGVVASVTPSGVISAPISVNGTDGTTDLRSITTGPDGNLWFTGHIQSGHGPSIIAVMTPGGVTTVFPDPGTGNAMSSPSTLVTGPDGNVWFANYASIGRITPNGDASAVVDPLIGHPRVITVGPDNNLWFTGGSAIDRLTTSGVVTMFTDPGITGSTEAITSGPDGNLWFTYWPHGIGRISATGTITLFTDPSVNNPTSITSGPDGNLWFADGTTAIGRITPSGAISTFTDPGIHYPSDLTGGPDGNLWFTNSTSPYSIGRITPVGVVTTFIHPKLSFPGAITNGPDGNLWFANGFASIGRITTSGAISVFSFGGIGTVGPVTTGPGGAIWFTDGSSVSRFTVLGTPGPPSSVIAQPGNGDATVWWTAPSDSGGDPVTGYTVTASPGGATCNWTAGPLSCRVSGLANGVPYTFTVTGTNGHGRGARSLPSVPATPLGVPPSAPLGVMAAPRPEAALVAWGSPNLGAQSVTSYTVTASPGGATCSSTSASGPPPLQCLVGGLDPAISYSFTVTATNENGTGPPSSPSLGITPAAQSSFYHAVQPQRILDTRPGADHVGSFGPWGPGMTRAVSLTTAPSTEVPATATAVVMNVTATGGTADGNYLTFWPAGTPRPVVSSLNVGANRTVANLITVKLNTVSPSATFSLFNAVGSQQVLLDVVGYFDPTPGAGFLPVSPARALDSRPPPLQVGAFNTPWGPGTTRDLAVAGSFGVPDNADAVVLNLTATNDTVDADFLTIWPAGTSRPTASSINIDAGRTVANQVIVKLGTGAGAGRISIFNGVGRTDAIVDVVGYFVAGAGVPFHAATPVRIIDSRPGPGQVGPYSQPWSQGMTRLVGATATLPGSPSGVQAVVVNVTAVGGTAPGTFVTLWPDGTPRPPTSNLNVDGGRTIANGATVRPSAGGGVDIFNALGTTDLIIDLGGWYG